STSRAGWTAATRSRSSSPSRTATTCCPSRTSAEGRRATGAVARAGGLLAEPPVVLVRGGRVRVGGRGAVRVAERVLVGHRVEVALVGDAGRVRLEELVHVVDVHRVVRLRRRLRVLLPDAVLADGELLAVLLRGGEPAAEPPRPAVE